MTNHPSIPSNWQESRTTSVKTHTSRRHRDASPDPEAAYSVTIATIQTIGRKLEVVDVEGDLDFYSAANTYLDQYAEALTNGRRPFDFLDSMVDARAHYHNLTWAQVKGVLNCLRADLVRDEARASQSAPVARKELTQDGMYRLSDGTIYKVQIAVHGSGKLYAKRLIVNDAEWSSSRGITAAKVTFEYEAGATRKLTDADKMTLEQAKEFGALYGTCCVCGRTLTDETSIAAGIGPICARRF